VKILGLSDREVSLIHGPNLKRTFGDVDLVLGCGDLPASYLEYVLTVLNVPLVFVPGNHDPDFMRVPGGIAADGRQVEVGGLRILGLGGSRRYKAEGRNQYEERQMRSRVFPHLLSLGVRRLLGGQPLDVLLTHAPPFGVHDADDLAHRGFQTFLTLIDWLQPALVVHGHTHVARNIDPVETKIGRTTVLNVYPYRVFHYPDEQ
jgi:Icc-related predicted phosphoesterase